MKDLPLSKVYQLLEPGPVVLLTTARKGPIDKCAGAEHSQRGKVFAAGALAIGGFVRSRCRGGRGGAMGFACAIRGLFVAGVARHAGTIHRPIALHAKVILTLV
jgi:hypothetical protein